MTEFRIDRVYGCLRPALGLLRGARFRTHQSRSGPEIGSGIYRQ